MAAESNIERAPPSSQATRLADFAREHSRAIEIGGLLLAIGIFLVSVLPNLANHPEITDDEMWVFSSAYKLAKEGVFGSDLFTGFYHAEDRYFFNMPAHHFAIAGAIKVLGAGIWEARFVGVIYGVATILLTYLLAKRTSGIPTAMLAIALLLFMRLNMGFDTGLPLQELASSMRYDLAPVPFVLGACLALVGGPSVKRSVIAGLLLGIAVLLQFYAAFMFPIAALFLWFEYVPREQRLKMLVGLVAAGALVGLPYGIFILSAPDDFRGQASTVDRRDDFTSPSFYIKSLRREPDRFLRPLAFKEIPRGEDPLTTQPKFLDLSEMLQRRPSAKLAVVVGLPVALIFLAVRWRQEARREDLLLVLSLAGLVVQFALFESAKLYIYWVIVVPFLCIGIAATVLHLLQPPRGDKLRLAAAALTAVALLGVFAEGSAARISGLQVANNHQDYETVRQNIREYVPEDSKVVGSTSLWWAMRDTEYRSYFMFFYLTRRDAGPYKTTISGYLDSFRPDYIVLTYLGWGELATHLIQKDYDDWQKFMNDHATHVVTLEGPDAAGYGTIDIWQMRY